LEVRLTRAQSAPQTWTSRKSDGAGCVNPTPLRPRRLNQCPNGDEGTARQHDPTPVALLWLCRHDHVVAVAPASRTRHGPRRRQSTDCVRFSSYRARTRLIASLSIQRSIPTRSTRACGWFLLGQDRAICGAACEVKRGPQSLACSPSIDADRSKNSSPSRSTRTRRYASCPSVGHRVWPLMEGTRQSFSDRRSDAKSAV
jgi:hypothetical protein